MGIDITYTAGVGYKMTEEESEVLKGFLDQEDYGLGELNAKLEHIEVAVFGGDAYGQGFIAFLNNDEWKALSTGNRDYDPLQEFDLPEPELAYGMAFNVSDESWSQLDDFFAEVGILPEDDEELEKFYDGILERTKFYLAVHTW